MAEFRVGDRVWHGSSGSAELRGTLPVDAGGWFRIGSVTKTFTATVILQLVGERRIRLDDPVERWLPGLVPDGDGITLRQLLDFTSGLHNYTDDLDLAEVARDRFRRWTPQEIVARATRHAPRFAPGTSRAYCNTSYILLGMVIAKVTGATYDTEVERRVLRPLGIRRTLVPGAADVLPEPHAHGYLVIGGRPLDVAAYDASHAGAAGGMVSTAGDLNRFFRALLTGELLRPAEMRLMQTVVPTTAPTVGGGLGIARVTLPNGAAVWGKDGGTFGYYTFSFHTAQAYRQLTVSVTDLTGARTRTHELLAGIAEVFGPEVPAAADLAPGRVTG
ncbi:serine hydrolase domain-containing protein [Polymorphospora rubra]|uniref:Serine hydrolase n=1 Tax=Polymorphospora rubra TaxID=338584 RepID=A0A810N0F6_9ACTN|nr:serine hydrolase [Polymorphospora rubra]